MRSVFITLMSAFFLTGCGGYTLRGQVVRGSFNNIMVVESANEHLQQTGVGNVRILVHRDPDRLNRELVATGVSGADGTFNIPIGAFGAGWMSERWMIQAEGRGYHTIEQMIALPGSDERLIITVMPGRSTPLQDQEDLWEQYEQFR